MASQLESEFLNHIIVITTTVQLSIVAMALPMNNPIPTSFNHGNGKSHMFGSSIFSPHKKLHWSGISQLATF